MVTHVALAEIGNGYRGGISHIKLLSANVIDGWRPYPLDIDSVMHKDDVSEFIRYRLEEICKMGGAFSPPKLPPA